MMSYLSRYSASGSSSRVQSTRDLDLSSPMLTVFELERLLYTGASIKNHADEVYPRLYLGDQDIAANRWELSKLGITHVLNCVHSKWRGGAEKYDGMGITYMGVEAHDTPDYDMSVHFNPAAEFIQKALSSGGKILVHCAVGVSRSATLVLAYLMIRERMTLVDAIKTVKDRRGIIPNRGFLRQLLQLDRTLHGNRWT